MRTKRPVGQLESIIEAARQEVVKRRKEAIAKGLVPEEATILTYTTASVIFGPKQKCTEAKKKWIGMRKPKISKESYSQLKNLGGSHVVSQLSKDVSLHVIHEMVDVYVTPQAEKRIEEERNVQSDNAGGQIGEGPGDAAGPEWKDGDEVLGSD